MTSLPEVLILSEPTLEFGYEQSVEDPRDGLVLFGPLDAGRPYGLRLGVIGTKRGVQYFRAWSKRIQSRLIDAGDPTARPPFPGFETAFRIPWAAEPAIVIDIPVGTLAKTVNIDDRHQRVHQTVGVFADRLLEAGRTEDTSVDLWFVVIPDVIYQNCRPKSNVAAEIRIKSTSTVTRKLGRRLLRWPSLFAQENTDAEVYQYDVDFHNQLKARLLRSRMLTQIVRESTIAPPAQARAEDEAARDTKDFQAAIAWNLGTSAFYKAGGRPWKIAGIRDRVCYLGLVFKKDETQSDPRTACCAAQMFLDSGDGVVFRGAVGPWYAPKTGDFHLSRTAANELVKKAVDAYQEKGDRGPPSELFIHGKVAFSDEEWAGFSDAVDLTKTKLVGVKIRDESDLRLFRVGSRPVLRGTAYLRHSRSAYLWTKGFSPRIRTYVGREVPRPLRVEVLRGDADMKTVLADIMALTKLNYNTCLLADGIPVTLRFADAIGEILTAAPVTTDNPLPFRHYIWPVEHQRTASARGWHVGDYGLRHLSRPPAGVSRTRSTCGAIPGFSSLALSIASF